MLGFLVTVTKTEENGGSKVAKWRDGSNGHFYAAVRNLEELGKAQCVHNGGGYPYIFHAKASDLMPLIEREINGLSDWENKGSFMMMGYGIVPDIPVATTKGASEIPSCSPEETLIIELWDLS